MASAAAPKKVRLVLLDYDGCVSSATRVGEGMPDFGELGDVGSAPESSGELNARVMELLERHDLLPAGGKHRSFFNVLNHNPHHQKLVKEVIGDFLAGADGGCAYVAAGSTRQCSETDLVNAVKRIGALT